MKPGVYWPFATSRVGLIRKIVGHYLPSDSICIMYTTENSPQNDCKRRLFSPPNGFQINPCETYTEKGAFYKK